MWTDVWKKNIKKQIKTKNTMFCLESNSVVLQPYVGATLHNIDGKPMCREIVLFC